MGKRSRGRHRENPTLLLAHAAQLAGEGLAAGPLVGRLAALSAAEVDTAASDALEAAVRRLWDRGWQPADVPRVVTSRLSPRHARLATAAIAADARRYLPGGCDERWAAQLQLMGASCWWPAGEPFVTACTPRGSAVRPKAIQLVVELLAALTRLPPLTRLCAPPGAPGAGHRRSPSAGRATGADPAILHRVRALLAKAESTSFPEEAEALAAKAQELITRHAIDRAVLAGASAGGHHGAGAGTPGGRRIRLDDPYVSAKALLVNVIARANRCRAVWSDLGYSEVFGYDDDIESVELLYTSLLAHATSTLARLGTGGDPRSRGRAFRRSFLIAFADRIGQRLADAAATATAAAEEDHGASLLPVLAARDLAVDEAFRAAYPRLGTKRYSVSDPAGYAAGLAAADLATLHAGGELNERAG